MNNTEPSHQENSFLLVKPFQEGHEGRAGKLEASQPNFIPASSRLIPNGEGVVSLLKARLLFRGTSKAWRNGLTGT